MNHIEKALASANETKVLILENGASKKTATVFKAHFPHKKAIIIADKTTYKILGKDIENNLKQNNIAQENAYIFKDPELYAEYSFVEELVAVLKQNDAIPIAVGSGTINDLTKLASHLVNRSYVCVATAASMDGYTAFGASITANGAKQTFNCPAPQICIADINIISKAPSEMTASGYADLFAKVTAGADWILANGLNVEPIDAKAWEIVQNGLHDALANPTNIKQGVKKDISDLVEGLILGGFAMQWHKTSRPASGAEHQFSHLWNMQHHLNNGEHISHGFQVSIGTLAIIALYEVALKTPFENLDIESALQQWPSAEELKSEATKMFKDTDFPEIGVIETKAKYINHDELRQQLQLLKSNWLTIKRRLTNQLVPFHEAKIRLALVGAPTDPLQIGITKEKLRDTFIKAQYIRRRFTILDLAVRTGYLETWLDEIFNNNSAWSFQKDLN